MRVIDRNQDNTVSHGRRKYNEIILTGVGYGAVMEESAVIVQRQLPGVPTGCRQAIIAALPKSTTRRVAASGPVSWSGSRVLRGGSWCEGGSNLLTTGRSSPNLKIRNTDLCRAASSARSAHHRRYAHRLPSRPCQKRGRTDSGNDQCARKDTRRSIDLDIAHRIWHLDKAVRLHSSCSRFIASRDSHLCTWPI